MPTMKCCARQFSVMTEKAIVLQNYASAKTVQKYSDVRNQYDPYGNLIMKQILVAPAEAKGTEFQPITRIWNTKGRIVEEKQVLRKRTELYLSIQYPWRSYFRHGSNKQ